VIDLFTRECLAIDAGQGLSGRDVVATLEHLRFEAACRNASTATTARSSSARRWTSGRTRTASSSTSAGAAKPTDNATIESFNGRFREECLNVHWFASLEDAQQKIDAYRWDYNEHHPHRAPQGLKPQGIWSKDAHSGRRLTRVAVRKTRTPQICAILQ
jgi:putative transposase